MGIKHHIDITDKFIALKCGDIMDFGLARKLAKDHKKPVKLWGIRTTKSIWAWPELIHPTTRN